MKSKLKMQFSGAGGLGGLLVKKDIPTDGDKDEKEGKQKED